eukprot:TRINITY_DN57351_c0_g1_i1.p1 TRINITY_DN57351_c0_g1~~TRINITY_DN57351_c0_g1_i1.p1  ORF type:complete len:361 (+),score=30.28 TRINITY_DN57351_c0_g1_i1:34-1116(+)
MPLGRLYVTNTAPTTTGGQLHELFTRFVRVREVQQRPSGAFVVVLENASDCSKALQRLNQYSLKGRRICVELTKGSSSKRSKSTPNNPVTFSPAQNTQPSAAGIRGTYMSPPGSIINHSGPRAAHPRVFVSGANVPTSVEDLMTLFETYGKVLEVQPRPSGNFVVVMETQEAANLAADELDAPADGFCVELTLGNQKRTQYQQENGLGACPRPIPGRLHISNLPPDCTAAELETLFVEFGKVLEVQQRPSGAMVVVFEKEADAVVAEKNLDGCTLRPGHNIHVAKTNGSARKSTVLRDKPPDETVSQYLDAYGDALTGGAVEAGLKNENEFLRNENEALMKENHRLKLLLLRHNIPVDGL